MNRSTYFFDKAEIFDSSFCDNSMILIQKTEIKLLASLGIIVGVLIGLFKFIYDQNPFYFFEHKLYRIASTHLLEVLNSCVLKCIIFAVIFYIIFISVKRILTFSPYRKKRSFQITLTVFAKYLLKIIGSPAIIMAVFLILFNVIIFIDGIFISRGPNILLITIDALRADHLSCYGYKKNTTPHISKFAEKGILFEKAVSQSSWTKPSMASLFTSTYPHTHMCKTFWDVLPGDILTFTEILKNNGYYTIGLQPNPSIKSAHNFNKGFDIYKEYHSTIRAEGLINEFFKTAYSKHSKFYAYIHFMDVHIPYNAPKKYNKQFCSDYNGVLPKNFIDHKIIEAIKNRSLTIKEDDIRHIVELYDAEISYVDEQLGIFFDQLKRMEILDNTIIIILSDHGEELNDHQGYEHGHTMYNELLLVPLIIIPQQDMDYKKLRIKYLVRLIDVFPTLFGLLNLELPETAAGMDLTKYLSNTDDIQLNAFSEAIFQGPEKKAIQTNHFKIIKNYDFQIYELYNLVDDPLEKNHIDNPELIEKYRRILENYISNKNSQLRKSEQNYDKSITEDLKSLGYLE